MKYLIVLLFTGLTSFAQKDSINLLEEVKLYGHFSKKLNCGYHLNTIKEKSIGNTTISLGELLKQEANFYFKENGKGMISSISLRGTGASHTGVYWNGIAINSVLNGQTDFNTISANGFNQIEIKRGSGSTLLGSGAIGGAINLKDIFTFKKNNTINSLIGIGSFNSQTLFLQGKTSTKDYDFKLSFDAEKSTNDYPYLNTENIINENGAYKKYQIKLAFAYKLNANNQIQIFSNYSNHNRELSRTITAPSKNLYKNEDQRILINWLLHSNKYTSSLKLAYLNEKYKFYLNKNIADYSFGVANSYITKYDLNYFIKKNISITIGLEDTFTIGNGTNILNKERNTLEGFTVFHHKITPKLSYNTSIRKGFSNIYQIPFIYAFDTRFDISNKWNIRANYSTNYKLPTFNDLYWEYSGNDKLLAERSNSSEIGLYFASKNATLSLTSYKINNRNLIQWRPVTNMLWKPINVQRVTNTGIEFALELPFKIKQHQFRFTTQYTYNDALDNTLDKQLIYVPYHKANANLNYVFKGFNIHFNSQYTGKVYTTTSNTVYLDEYFVFNTSIYKNIYKNKINIGFHINNIFNRVYENVAFRPMPNRNYKLNINYKI